MRNNKKKGFTLVELLVVIAILAILATVAVVGYTSYIEGATVRVDEDLAVQLTRFLEAYKVNNPDEINEHNVREVTANLLKEGGLDELVAQSAKYGYGFYYDLQEGKYVLLDEEQSGIKTAGYKVLFSAEAAGESAYEIKLENCFTPDNRYFYVGTPHESTPLAEIINSFYSFTSTSDYTTLKTKVDGTGIQKLITFVTNSVVVTDDCNYRLGSNPTNVIFVNGVQSIGTTTKQWNGSAWTDVTVNDSYTLASITGPLTIPNSVKYMAGNSLNVGTTATIVFNKTAAELGNMAFQHFTDATIKTNDGTYHSGSCACGNVDHTGRDVIVSDADATVDVLLNFYNPANEFDVVVEEAGEKQVFNTQESDGTKFAYVSWDLESFDASSANRVGSLYPELPSSTLEKEFAWSISDNNLAIIDSSTGVVTFTGEQPTAENCTFTVTGTVNGVSTSCNIKVVAVYQANIKIADKDVTANSTHTLVFNNSVDGQNGTYSVASSNVVKTFDVDEIILNENITITATGSKVSLDGTNLKVADDVSGTTTDTITIKYGAYTVASNKTITLYDADVLPFAVKHSNIKYVGNSNTLSASDFFAKKDENWTIPANATLMVYEGASNTESLIYDPDRATIATSNTAGTWGVTDSSVEGFNTAFQFHGTRTSGPAYLCLVIDGVIVSPDIPVTVVEGENIRSWKELAGTEAAMAVSKTTSIVMLSDITMPSADTPTARFALTGATLYGNCFTFNIKDGVKQGYFGIITLENSKMQDTRVVGDLYPTVAIQAPDLYGTNAVYAKGTTTIENCYIANCRAPLASGNEGNNAADVITVKNSVLFGGRYANIDLRGGTLKFEGKVIAINQPHTDNANADNVAMEDRIAGFGIAVWLEAPAGTNIQNIDKLTQYNFIPETYNKLPTVSLTAKGITVSADCNDLFEDIFTEKVLTCTNTNWTHSHKDSCYSDELKYGDYHFTRGTTKYINPGVLGEDIGDSASSLVNLIGMNMPSGDRTGYNRTAPSNYQYTSMKVVTNYYVISVTVHTYGVLGTQTDLFAASENTEFIYSPWNQTAGEETYEAYGFTNGSILPPN